MIKHLVCPSCGRHRKRSHEKRCGTKRAYTAQCQRLPRHPENRDWMKRRGREIRGGSLQPA